MPPSRALRRLAPPLALAAALVGCAVAPPAGPTVLMMPGPDKTLATFDADDGRCRRAAAQTTDAQRPYDITYSQCMVAAGNTLPAYASGGSYAHPLYGYPYPPPYPGYPLY